MNIFNLKKSLFLIGLIFIFVFVPLHSAEAVDLGFGSIIDELGNNIKNHLVNLVFGLVSFSVAVAVLMISFAMNVVSAILTWLINISLSIPITNTEIVNVGWAFTRDLVNMGFLVILAWIGLSVILKIREYDVQKIIPKLLLIALLVNFSLVLVGFVVDIGNLITNFFFNRYKTLDFDLIEI